MKKVTWYLEGCETKIRQACASELTQRDWCEIWARAKEDAKKGKIALLSALLPIVARKMPESAPPPPDQDIPVSDDERQVLANYANPDANA